MVMARDPTRNAEDAKGARRKAPPGRKRAARREALLDEASRQINERGADAIVVNDIAERVGLSRNALYYYVADRSDLVFRCYLRACETMADDLVAAEEVGSSAADRLAVFIARALDYERPALAVLSDIDFLAPPQRQIIRDLNARNVEGLRGLIREGVAAGEFRPCDDEIAAQCLIGMLAWARLAANWMQHRDGRATRRRMAGAITDLLLRGFAADDTVEARCDIDVEVLVAKPFNAFDRRQTNEVKITQLIAAASRLFNRHGIDGTSLDDISAAVGATKGAVYHYFDDKADLVARCYRRAFELYDAFMAAALSADASGFQKALMVMHLNIQAQAGPLSPLMLQPGGQTLDSRERDKISRAARKLRLASTRTMRQGVADGSCRPLDAAFTSELAAGVFLWLPKWLPQDYPLTPMQVADEISALFAFGVLARPRVQAA